MRKLLKPLPSPITADRARVLDARLAEVIDGRTRGLFGNRPEHRVLRYPPVEILHELPNWAVWFPVPHMHGGFHIELRIGYLEVVSWSLVPNGLRQMHLITHDGSILVDQAAA